MFEVDDDRGLAFRFACQLRDKDFRTFIARSGYISGVTITVVSEKTVIDQDVLRRSGEHVAQEAPGTEFGWRILPE
jgi:hypothetical protein